MDKVCLSVKVLLSIIKLWFLICIALSLDFAYSNPAGSSSSPSNRCSGSFGSFGSRNSESQVQETALSQLVLPSYNKRRKDTLEDLTNNPERYYEQLQLSGNPAILQRALMEIQYIIQNTSGVVLITPIREDQLIGDRVIDRVFKGFNVEILSQNKQYEIYIQLLLNGDIVVHRGESIGNIPVTSTYSDHNISTPTGSVNSQSTTRLSPDRFGQSKTTESKSAHPVEIRPLTQEQIRERGQKLEEEVFNILEKIDYLEGLVPELKQTGKIEQFVSQLDQIQRFVDQSNSNDSRVWQDYERRLSTIKEQVLKLIDKNTEIITTTRQRLKEDIRGILDKIEQLTPKLKQRKYVKQIVSQLKQIDNDVNYIIDNHFSMWQFYQTRVSILENQVSQLISPPWAVTAH